MKLSDTITDTK